MVFGKFDFWRGIVGFRLFLTVLIICFGGIAHGQTSASDANRRMLVLHSYHCDLPWTKGLMTGLQSALATAQTPVALHVEYLDTIRHRPENVFPVFKTYLREKYQDVLPDVIVATDDVALDFLFLHRQKLFPGVPVVFCGPNDLKPERLYEHSNITGIAENPDMRGTLELILGFHPQGGRIALVSDRNPASLRVIEGLRHLEHELNGRFSLTLLTDASLEALMAELQALPSATPVLFHAFLRDAAGRTFPSNLKILEKLTTASQHPFYTFKKIDIGYGALGGAVISEVRMAEIAGRMALRILEGDVPDDIPVVYDTPHTYLFDYDQLKRFGIGAGALPADSQVINRPLSLYHTHKTAVSAIAATFLALLLLLLLMTAKNRRNTRERRRTEAKLHASRILLETAVAQSPSGILIAEAPDVTIRLANPAAFGIRGGSPETLIHIDLTQHATNWQIFYPDGTPCPSEQLPLSRAVLKGEITRNEELIIRDQNDRDHWVSASAAPVRDTQGHITAGIVVFHDITDRKQAEWALRESEARYHVLFEESPDACLILDQGIIVECNRAATTMLQAERTQIVGSNPADFSPEYQPDGTLSTQTAGEKIAVALQTGRLLFEWTHRRRNDQDFQAEVFLARMTMKQQTVLFASMRDITDRKQAEKALRDSEAKLKNLFDTMPNGYYLSTADGRFIDANPAFVKMLGYTNLEELLQLDIPKDVYVRETDRTHYIQKAVNSEFLASSHAESYRLKTKDGRVIHVEDNARYIMDAQGRVQYHEGICRDVTDRKRAEEEQVRLQEQLLQAQKMESVGILAGGVAHDFNNMLQAIGGYTQLMLLDKQADHPDYAKLEALSRTVNRAAELVRQLLFFSRKAASQRQPLNLNLEVLEAATILERTIPRMITIENHLGPHLWLIDADPVQIQQVLLNLGSNAADAMPEGGQLSFETANIILDEQFARTHATAVPGNYVRLSVSDTGSGMDADTVSHIFEPFFTTKEIGRGTGLGLASAYGIIKAHEGHILCYSEPERGTTFKIYLPAQTTGHPEAEAEPETKANLPGGTETILVVDDEADIREVATEALSHFGYSVLSAASGEAALEVYRNHADSIRLVILDIGMPGMGGGRCLQELLKLNPDVRVLIASGYATLEQSWKKTISGAAGFVGKPYQLDELLRCIRGVLDAENEGRG